MFSILLFFVYVFFFNLENFLLFLNDLLNQINTIKIKYPILSILFFLIFYILIVILNLPIGLPMSTCAGFMFGVFIGTFSAVMAITIGSFIVFKLLSTASMSKQFDKFKIVRLNIFKHLYNNKVRVALLIRIIPGTPIFLQNLILANLKISDTLFLITTMIGCLPITYIIVFFGSKFNEIINLNNQLSLFDIFDYKSIIFLIFLIILILVFNKNEIKIKRN